MVLYYARGGNFKNWINRDFDWKYDMRALKFITIRGLEKIHEKKMVHCDLHIGNILFSDKFDNYNLYISDMDYVEKNW